jgi:hypothetical protein
MRLGVKAKLRGTSGVVLIALVAVGVAATLQIGQAGNQADLLFSQNLKTEMKTGILRRDMAATLSEAVSRFKLDDSARLGGPDSGSSTSESSESEELAAQAKFNSAPLFI